MNERANRALLLFFSGYTQGEIAVDLGTHISSVNALINAHGGEWVVKCLRDDHKQRILELASDKKNTQAIAEILGKPWNRYSVQFVLRKLRLFALKESNDLRTRNSIKAKELATEIQHSFRCSRCGCEFRQSLKISKYNPDVLCPTTPDHNGCIDKRLGERRTHNRVDPT